ncbi:delta-60 repeat domain-containing protein [Jidongwangia harbinensis]|uniref:delta-60 repeat domain-containing protein n=1 Tax=Jidongwangia harbinensis TaxID=2878561 RepID=UPI001CD9C63A|nr:delta-60 repeat domain-containing protein [Jidongwangia harbinensis]MCA2216467.1 delta-60 repeat domain-containing protein [Jidongwangia harbinensis]
MVPALVLGLTVATTAIPAQAVYIPSPAPARLVSGNPVDYTPHAQNGSIRAFAQIGNTIYAGGSFTGIKAAGAADWSPASYLVAYDAGTGALRPNFTPEFDNAVQTLAISPDGKLIVGGNFGTVNGVARKNLVALDPATGDTIGSWVGRADGGVVRRAVVHGNYLYIAGAFHWVNGTEHSLLARLNATTGAIDASFQVDASGARPMDNSFELVWAIAVSPDGGTLVATGNFTVVNGEPRNQVAVIDTTGLPTVTSWHTDRYEAPCHSGFPFYARDVDFSDDGSHFVIIADGGRGDGYCDAIVRYETAHRGEAVATWVNFTGTDSVTSVEVADGIVYVAGHFRWLNNANGSDRRGNGGIDRYGLGALDANNGLPLNWNPGRSPGGNLPDGGTNWGPIVWELWKGSNGLYVGQDSDGLGNEYHGRQALFPTASGRTVAVQDAPQGSPGFLYLGAGNGQVTKVPYGPDGLGTPAVVAQPNLTSARSAFVVANKLYWSKTDVTAPSGSVFSISMFTGGTIGAPWTGNSFNSWYNAAAMNGAFYLNGRMYYVTSTGNALQYRYLTPDGYLLGCSPFTLPTEGIDWRTVRGMTLVNGNLVYGSIDGTLRSVPFDPAADVAVDATAATVVAAGTPATTWSNPTLFYATS